MRNARDAPWNWHYKVGRGFAFHYCTCYLFDILHGRGCFNYLGKLFFYKACKLGCENIQTKLVLLWEKQMKSLNWAIQPASLNCHFTLILGKQSTVRELVPLTQGSRHRYCDQIFATTDKGSAKHLFCLHCLKLVETARWLSQAQVVA